MVVVVIVLVLAAALVVVVLTVAVATSMTLYSVLNPSLKLLPVLPRTEPTIVRDSSCIINKPGCVLVSYA